MKRLMLLAILVPLLVSAPGAFDAAGAGQSVAPRPLRVVGLGDSVMSSRHCDCAGPTVEYAAALSRRLGRAVTQTNLGRGGLVTGDVLQALRHDPATRRTVSRADVVLIIIGANDLMPEYHQWRAGPCGPSCFRHPAELMGDNVRRILHAVGALRPGRQDSVLVTNYWNVFADGAVARRQGGQYELDWNTVVTETANGAICRAAAATDTRCVDLVAPFKGDGSGDPTDLLLSDGNHPNARGVRAIVSALLASSPFGVLRHVAR